MDCGGREAVQVAAELYFDFDPIVLPPPLRKKMMTRRAGVCFSCGLFQDFLRFTAIEMRQFADFNKDESVSESASLRYPVEAAVIEHFDRKFSYRRLERWEAYFDDHNVSIHRCLFLRPMFGTTLAWTMQHFGCEVAALEISEVCRRTTRERVPTVRFLKGQIHGLLEGPFTEQEPFDAVFVNHTLVHTIDIHAAIDTLKGLVRPDGFVLFSDEIQIKPQNPFHMVFASEHQLTRILMTHFSRVDRIDDCLVDPPPFISRFSTRGDGPDLVGWL